jgi:hypothetical protein
MEAWDAMNNLSNNTAKNGKEEPKAPYHVEKVPHNNATPIGIKKRCLHWST